MWRRALLVGPQNMADGRFWEDVMSNRGFDVRVFTKRVEALR